jgi:hypothetical protein
MSLGACASLLKIQIVSMCLVIEEPSGNYSSIQVRRRMLFLIRPDGGYDKTSVVLHVMACPCYHHCDPIHFSKEIIVT